MTWKELAKRIAEMSNSKQDKTAYYREPWDDSADMFPVDVYKAKENLADHNGKVCVETGEFFLQ